VEKIGIDLDVKELERNLAFTRDNNNENQMITWANDGSEMIYLFPRHAIPVDAAEAHMGMAYAQWYASRGHRGQEARRSGNASGVRSLPRSVRRIGGESASTTRKRSGRSPSSRCGASARSGQSPAVMGVRIVKNNMGNVPERTVNAQHARTPHSSMPITYYFK
jgi:peptide/nickel transport system substrate-binding protein